MANILGRTKKWVVIKPYKHEKTPKRKELGSVVSTIYVYPHEYNRKFSKFFNINPDKYK